MVNTRVVAFDDIFPRFVFIPLFIIFAAACLLIAGCTGEDVAAPDGDGDAGDQFHPRLVIWEPLLGTKLFLYTFERPPAIEVFPDLEFSFLWYGVSLNSGYTPLRYRYGWDIQDLEDDDEWACDWSSRIKRSEPRSFSSGVHVFFAEVKNIAGQITRARVEIEVIPYTAERDLLWIDDFRLGDYIPSMMLPSEEEHDRFWTEICSRVPGFDPAMDIYEADNYSGDRIPLSVLADYRSVVWTFDSSPYTSWRETIVFDPLPTVDPMRANNLKMFLSAGGSALTCGRGDSRGSLYETFAYYPQCPASTEEDISPGDYYSEYFEYSMARDDYRVTVIDKVVASFKTGADMPADISRSLHMDAFMMAFETGEAPGLDLPDTIMLDETVTCPWCFFYPMERGFYYVEAYDPGYYMDHIGATSLPGFTPIYTMRTRSTLSPLNGAAIALRTPHGSCHFGFPLWFMEHEKVEQIADEIFRSWDIR
jgi:hypothetical protein